MADHLTPLTKNSDLPAWWPDWMTPPILMADGHVRALGDCRECGATQYPVSYSESHRVGCSRYADPRAANKRAPWPHNWRG